MNFRQALEEQSQQNPNNLALLPLERAPLTYTDSAAESKSEAA